MIPTDNTMHSTLVQCLQDLHTRIAATILELDEDALNWQPAPATQSVHDLLRHAANEERRWVGEGIGNIPVADESRFAMIQLASGQPVDKSLDEVGGVGQVRQMILGNLSPTDWEDTRSVSGRTVTVATCVLQTLVELARILGHIESTCQLWNTMNVRS